MRVLVVAEYYPRVADPVLGLWAHRQALASREAGVELRVLVLHRPVAPLASLRSGDLGAVRAALSQPREAMLDGLPVRYVRYLSPPRPWSYRSWGAWAARPLKLAAERVRQEFPFDLVHAHNAIPSGDAVRRALPSAPLVLSVHGGDLYGVWARGRGARAVRTVLGHADLILANSAGTARRCVERGARNTRVVHLGADVAASSPSDRRQPPVLVTIGHLVERKRHVDVIAALPALREKHPGLRYVIVGDGPQRESITKAAQSLGLTDAVELRGALEHPEALAVARTATVFVMPSVDEAFGVAYIEAMAAGIPAIGCRGEDGPEEIAARGEGIELVPPRDTAALVRTVDSLLSDPARLAEQGARARRTVIDAFTWERCGRETATAYEHALARVDRRGLVAE